MEDKREKRRRGVTGAFNTVADFKTATATDRQEAENKIFEGFRTKPSYRQLIEEVCYEKLGAAVEKGDKSAVDIYKNISEELSRIKKELLNGEYRESGFNQNRGSWVNKVSKGYGHGKDIGIE